MGGRRYCKCSGVKGVGGAIAVVTSGGTFKSVLVVLMFDSKGFVKPSGERNAVDILRTPG